MNLKNVTNFFKESKFIKIQTYLICSLPLLLTTGSAIPDFIVSVSSVSFLIYLIIHYENVGVFIEKKLFKYLLFFYFFIVFSSLFSLQPLLSLKFSVFYLRFILFAFLISFLIKNNGGNFYKFFFLSCSISVIFLFADSIFQFFNKKNILGFVTMDSEHRISSIFSKMILGSYILKLLPMFLASIFYMIKIKKYSFNIFVFFYLISFFIIFLSGDRAPLFLMVIFSIGLIIALKEYRKRIFLSLFFLLCILIILVFTQKRFTERYVTRTLNELGLGNPSYQEVIVGENNTNPFYTKKNFIFSSTHENYFVTALNIFEKNILIGAGPKSFGWLSCEKEYQVDKFSCINHPHNFYIQLLAETGIIGFGLVLFAFFYFIKYLSVLILSNQKQYEFSKGGLIIPLIGMITHLWPITTNGSFFTNYNCILIFFCLGFFLGEKKII